MNITIGIALAVCLIGLVIYFVSTHSKVQEIGRLSFFAGLFVFLLELWPHLIR